jgi:hypothetical protein
MKDAEKERAGKTGKKWGKEPIEKDKDRRTGKNLDEEERGRKGGKRAVKWGSTRKIRRDIKVRVTRKT